MLLQVPSNWDYWSKFGVTGAILFVLSLFFYKKIWPIFEARFKEADNAQRDAQAILTSQLVKAEQRIERSEQIRENLLQEFAENIEENNRVSRRVAESLDEILRRIK